MYIARHRKHWYSCWNVVANIHTNCELRYSLSHFRLQAAIFDSPLTLTRKSDHTSPTVFLDLKMAVSTGSLLLCHSHHEILVISGLWPPFGIVVVVALVWRHPRHQKKYALVPLSIGESRIIQFRSVPEIQVGAAFAAPTAYVTNIEPLFDGK